MSVEDYDILNILGKSINSTTYKVKHKKTKQIYIWKTVDYEHLNAADVEYLIEKLRNRRELYHPNVLNFFTHIEHKESKVMYIMTEYCENGSLRSILDSCLANNTRLSEELVCKILYQIAFTIKTIDNYTGKLNPKEILLDEDFNVKLFDFQLDYLNKRSKEPKMCYLGLTLYEICTFKTFDKNNYNYEFSQINGAFSQNLLSLIICMIKDGNELKKNINKVLCHPTVLLKSTQWIKEKSFLKIENSSKVLSETEKLDENALYLMRIEKLRNKEIALQIREQQLIDREHKLAAKERKITIMERTAREKNQQAELYLKRCRETKSTNSGSTKLNIPSQRETKLCYENLDSTYVSCGDSILLPTSAKLNVSKIVKLAPFTRTLSERRIRFKGHSPLKDMDFNKRRTTRPKLQKGDINRLNSEWLTCSDDTDKSSIEGSTKTVMNKSKQLFPSKSIYANDDLHSDVPCQPITWTDENKKCAFELLRVMNDKENQCLQVKHTYL